jgi:hypothetical protein
MAIVQYPLTRATYFTNFNVMQSTSGNLTPSVIQTSTVPQETQDAFHWINNEALLRDEGALFGIAAAEIDDKLNAIESFFKTRMSEALVRKQFLEQKIQEHDLVIGVNRKEVTSLADQLEESRQKNNMLPSLVQFLAVLCVCIFNFFVVRWWLSPSIDSDLICAGIYLSGLFSFYISRAVNNPENTETEEAEKGWKINLREFAVAAGVALFICILTYRSYPAAHSVAAFLMLCIGFFAGKVLMNSIAQLKEEGGNWLQHATQRWRLKKQQKQLTKAIEQSLTSIDAARAELQEPSILLKKLEAEQEYKTRIFLSEYNLALQSRNASSKSPAKQFA